MAPSRVTDVLMVVRTYPIRVAGNSGYMKNEISWDELNQRVKGVIKILPEKTTVTHKIRRIAEWDQELFEQACTLNAPTQIALTFADYIDPNLYEESSDEKIMESKPLKEFITGKIPSGLVRYIGTGPKTVVEIKGGYKWE